MARMYHVRRLLLRVIRWAANPELGLVGPNQQPETRASAAWWPTTFRPFAFAEQENPS